MTLASIGVSPWGGRVASTSPRALALVLTLPTIALLALSFLRSTLLISSASTSLIRGTSTSPCELPLLEGWFEVQEGRYRFCLVFGLREHLIDRTLIEKRL